MMVDHHLLTNRKREEGEECDDLSLDLHQLVTSSSSTTANESSSEDPTPTAPSNDDCLLDTAASSSRTNTNNHSSSRRLLLHKLNNPGLSFLNTSTTSLMMMKVETDNDDDQDHECYSIVLSRAQDPGIAEDWDSTWESLYTMDDDTIYTTITGQSSKNNSNNKRGVIIEGMPLLPSTNHRTSSKKRASAQMKGVEDAIAHLSRCAADQGMNRVELFEFVDFLMEQQKSDKGKRALTAAKKALLQSDRFLATTSEEEDCESGGALTTTRESEEDQPDEGVGDPEEEEAEDDDDLETTGAREMASLSTVRQVNSSPKRAATRSNAVDEEDRDEDEIEIQFYREAACGNSSHVESDADTQVYFNHRDSVDGSVVVVDGAQQEMTSESEVSRDIPLPPLNFGTAELWIPPAAAADERGMERPLPWMEWVPPSHTKHQQSQPETEEIEFFPQAEQPIRKAPSCSLPQDIDALFGQRRSFSPPVASTSFNKSNNDEATTPRNITLIDLPPSPPKERIVVLPSISAKKDKDDKQGRGKRGLLHFLATFSAPTTTNSSGKTTKKMGIPSLFQKKSSSGGKGSSLFSSTKKQPQQQHSADSNKHHHRRHRSSGKNNPTQGLEHDWSFSNHTAGTTASSSMMTSGSEHTMDTSLSEYSSARDWSLGGSSRGPGGGDHHVRNNNNNNNNNNYVFGVRKLGVVYEGRLFEC